MSDYRDFLAAYELDLASADRARALATKLVTSCGVDTAIAESLAAAWVRTGDYLFEGMEDISRIPNLVRGLMERGYSDQSILKILGGNTLRVMRDVERVARASPARAE